jgi:catechol 2,3-dioxygenase-like lactoylglutathione lyase family enzyme
MKVTGLDHLVLDVADTRRSVEWYSARLGLTVERLAEWERGEAAFVSLRVDADTIIDLLESPRSGTNVDHVCLVVADVDLDALVDSGEFEVTAGPVEVWGARGLGRSVYVLDPDEHLVELRVYP